MCRKVWNYGCRVSLYRALARLCRFSWDNYKCLFWLLTSLITLFSMFWFCHWGNHYSCTQVLLNWQPDEKMEFKATNCTGPHRCQDVAIVIKTFYKIAYKCKNTVSCRYLIQHPAFSFTPILSDLKIWKFN